jgi:hypothetical protein
MWDGGGVNQPFPPGPVCTHQSLVSQFLPTHSGIKVASDCQGTGGVDTIHSSFAAALHLPPFPLFRQPVSSQYLHTLLSYWLGLSLVPLSCHIPVIVTMASSTGPLLLLLLRLVSDSLLLTLK